MVEDKEPTFGYPPFDRDDAFCRCLAVYRRGPMRIEQMTTPQGVYVRLHDEKCDKPPLSFTEYMDGMLAKGMAVAEPVAP